MKKIFLSVLLAIVLLGLFILSAFINRRPVEKQTFKIGADLALTGSLSEAAEAFRAGILIAIDEINRNGGVNGKTVVPVIEDDQLEPKKMVSIAQKLVDVDKVDSAIVSAFLQAQTAGNIYEQSKTPMIVLWDSNPQIDDMGQYIFAIGPWTPSSGEVSATYAYNVLHARKVSIMATNEPWPIEVVNAFKKTFEELGGKVVDTGWVNLGQANDFRALITKAVSFKPDVLYTPIDEEATTFYKQLKVFNFPGKVITSDIITDSVINESGDATDGVYQSQPMDPSGPVTDHMVKLYREKYGKEPKNILFTAWAYDAVRLIAEAAEGAKNKDDIKNNMYKIKDFPGASSRLTINEKGSAPMMESIFEIEKGKFIPVGN